MANLYTLAKIKYSGAVSTAVHGFDALGNTYGAFLDAESMPHIFVLDRYGSWTTLDIANAYSIKVNGLNPNGYPYGFFKDANGKIHGFAFYGGGLKVVDYPSAASTVVRGASTDGDKGFFVFGSYTDSSGNTYSFIQKTISLDDRSYYNDNIPSVTYSKIHYGDANKTNIFGLYEREDSYFFGSYIDNNNKTHGFIYSHSTQIYTPFDFPGSTGTSISGIANIHYERAEINGAVFGHYVNASGIKKGFININDTYRSISPSSAASTTILGLTKTGQAYGNYKDAQGNSFGFFEKNDASSFYKYKFPGATSTTIAGLTDFGDVFGSYTDSLGTHGFALINGSYKQIDFSGASSSVITQVDSLGNAHGFYTNSSGSKFGFVAENPVPFLSGALSVSTFPFDNPDIVNSEISVDGFLYTQFGGSSEIVKIDLSNMTLVAEWFITRGLDIALSPDGKILYLSGGEPNDNTPIAYNDGVLSAINTSDGTLIWQKIYDLPSGTYAWEYNVSCDPEGNIFVTLDVAAGYTTIYKYNKDGDLQLSFNVQGTNRDVVTKAHTDHNIFVSEKTYDASTNSTFAYLSKFDNFGSKIWSSKFGQGEGDGILDIEIANDGSIYVSGTRPVGQNLISKYDPDGNNLWSYSTGVGTFYSIILDKKENLVFVTSGPNGLTLGALDASSGYCVWHQDIVVSKVGILSLATLSLDSDGSILLSVWAGKDNQIFGVTTGDNPNVVIRISPDGILKATNSNDDMYGSNNADNLSALDGDDDISSAGGDDIIYAGSGDDDVNAGLGDDLIIGGDGAGDDYYNGGEGIDTVKYTSALAAVSINLSSGHATSTAGNDAAGIGTDTLAKIENIIAGDFDDTLTGDGQSNTFFGGDGNDRLKGELGKDNLNGGKGSDTVDYSDKTHAVSVALNGSTAVSVKVNGINEDTIRNIENIIGGKGNDTLTGDGNVNVFRGGGGKDSINGGTGSDTSDYSEKDQNIEVALNGSTAVRVKVNGVNEDTIRNIENIIGGAGNDTILGDINSNNLDGESGNDFLSGRAGNDILRGGLGSDTLKGGTGKDTLYAGIEADQDTFIFTSISDSATGTNRDQIHDFVSGTDLIDLSLIDANNNPLYSGNQAFNYSGTTASANSVWYVISGTDVIVQGDVNGNTTADFEIFVKGVNFLSANDFLL